MKNLIIISVLLFSFFSDSFSQNLDNENFKVTHGPYIQNLTTSGVTIIWTTNRPAVPAVILTTIDGTSKRISNSHDGLIDAGGMLHKVRIDGLEPGVLYKYSVNSVQIIKYQSNIVYYGDTIRGKTEGFSMPSLNSEKVVFSVMNDVHENSGKMASYLKKGNTDKAEFFIFNGDMIDFLQSTNQLFTGFLDTAVYYFASRKPFYYVRGNHEARGYLARDLKNYFDIKDNRFYYSFDKGPVHFVVLDCGEGSPDNDRSYSRLADFNKYKLEELEWLRNEVKSDLFRKAKYRIVIIHMPVVKEDNQAYGLKFLADNFGPVLQGKGVDLMLSAHIHRNAFYESGKSGFGYPVLVNSNETFIEVEAGVNSINAVVKDVSGNILNSYTIK